MHDHLEILRRGKIAVIVVFVIVLAAVTVYTVLTPKEFEAYTLLLVDTHQSSSSRGNVTDPLNLGKVHSPGFSGKNIIENQTLILRQSLLIAQRTAEKLTADEALKKDLTVLATKGTPPTKNQIALRIQEDYVSVSPADKHVDILKISAQSTNPREAAAIANTYTQEYVRFTSELGHAQISSSRKFLESQIAARKEELNELENEIKQYKKSKGAVALDEASEYTISQIAQLEATLDEAKIQQQMHKASLASLEKELKQIHPKLSKRVASSVEQEIEQAQAKIAELELLVEQIYLRNPALRSDPSGNPQLVELNKQIIQLRSRVKKLSEQYVSELLAVGGIDPMRDSDAMRYITRLNRQVVEERIAISGAEAKVEALQQRLGAYGRKLESIPEQVMQLAQLERARLSTERLYILLMEQLQEANIAEKMDAGGTEIIRPAIVPDRPEKPNVQRNMIFGALLALFLGIGAAYARYRMDSHIYTPDELLANGFEMLAAIPDLDEVIKGRFNGTRTTKYKERDVSTQLVSLLAPATPSAESFRRLFLNLQHACDPTPKSVLITSAEEDAGKSTIALNLALAAAANGKRTLLLDADLLRPTIHQMLDRTPRSSLKEVLESESGPDLGLFETGIDNLWALTSANAIELSVKVIGQSAMKKLMEKLKAEFDFIVMDSPPVLLATDAAVLSLLCDTTLVAVSSGSTDVGALRQIVRELKDVGSHVAGTVLNRFDPTRMYGYKFTYGYRLHSRPTQSA